MKPQVDHDCKFNTRPKYEPCPALALAPEFAAPSQPTPGTALQTPSQHDNATTVTTRYNTPHAHKLARSLESLMKHMLLGARR